MNLLLKGLMGASIGSTFFTMLFLAPSGAVLTSGASMDKVQRQAAASARGPRYVFVGGYYGGK
jgi:hypothetical protein